MNVELFYIGIATVPGLVGAGILSGFDKARFQELVKRGVISILNVLGCRAIGLLASSIVAVAILWVIEQISN
jgi:hypothetical protein